MATVELVLAETTRRQLQKFITRPPQGLLIVGGQGSGKGSVSRMLAAETLGTPVTKLADHPYCVILEPTNNSIGIETVRELDHFLSLKPTPNQATPISRIIIIQDAHYLTSEAQNSLLKTLEEPPADTMLILTAVRSEALLPTVRSRLQTLSLQLPPAEELKALLLSKGVTASNLNTIMAVSGGLPGLAVALAEEDESHPLVAAAAIVRQLLQRTTFERLTLVDGLAKDKETCQGVIHVLLQMAHAGALSGRTPERWQRVLQAGVAAQESFSRGGQPKLVMTNLMLSV